MQTTHYIITNIENFSGDIKAVEKLKNYLDDIESIFPTIEEVFGQTWNNNQINIKLNDSTGGAFYTRLSDSHIVDMGIYNGNIQKKYPENLWGCLFHETHHAFLNPITHNKRDGKILNGGQKKEVFNHAFMATTYLKLKEKGIIDTRLYEYFLDKLERELLKGEPLSDVMGLFKEYVDIFSLNENFAKFISYLKSSNSVFTDISNFRQDLNKVREYLGIAKNS